MSIGNALKLYLVAAPLFFLVDMLWLGVVARGFYQSQLGYILADRVNWSAAILFYLIYVAGILWLAVLPGLKEDSLPRTLLLGAGLGLFTYATYELTNLATLPQWPLAVVIVDIAWGIVLCTLVAGGTHLIGKHLLRRAGLDR